MEVRGDMNDLPELPWLTSCGKGNLPPDGCSGAAENATALVHPFSLCTFFSLTATNYLQLL